MSKAVSLSDRLVLEAKTYSKASSRSVAKQIEHWVKIGRIAKITVLIEASEEPSSGGGTLH